MSCRRRRAVTRSANSVAVKWLESYQREGLREPVGYSGHRHSKLMSHRDFSEPARVEKLDSTLQALCDHLLSERGSRPTRR